MANNSNTPQQTVATASPGPGPVSGQIGRTPPNAPSTPPIAPQPVAGGTDILPTEDNPFPQPFYRPTFHPNVSDISEGVEESSTFGSFQNVELPPGSTMSSFEEIQSPVLGGPSNLSSFADIQGPPDVSNPFINPRNTLATLTANTEPGTQPIFGSPNSTLSELGGLPSFDSSTLGGSNLSSFAQIDAPTAVVGDAASSINVDQVTGETSAVTSIDDTPRRRRRRPPTREDPAEGRNQPSADDPLPPAEKKPRITEKKPPKEPGDTSGIDLNSIIIMSLLFQGGGRGGGGGGGSPGVPASRRSSAFDMNVLSSLNRLFPPAATFNFGNFAPPNTVVRAPRQPPLIVPQREQER